VLVVDHAIRSMLASIKKYIPWNQNIKWKLQKFHDILHISQDMHIFGCPQNWDASPGEHNLIKFALFWIMTHNLPGSEIYIEKP